MDSYNNFGIYENTETSLMTATNSLNSLVPNLVNNGTSSSALQSGSMNLQGSLVNGYLQSSNFVAGTIGWQIKANGDVEFNNGIFRGSIKIGTGNNVFIADANGIYLGGSTFATAPFTVDMQGNMVVSSLRRKDFHWFTLFESTSNYLKSGSVAENFSFVRLSVNNSTSYLKKGSSFGTQFSWTKPMSVSCGVIVNQSTSQQIWLVSGDVTLETNEKVGFYININTLYGWVASGSDSTVVNLGSFSGATSYDLKAVFYPGVRVDYYVNGTLVNNITTTLPTGSVNAGIFMNAQLYTVQAIAKTLDIFYWDFWQGV